MNRFTFYKFYYAGLLEIFVLRASLQQEVHLNGVNLVKRYDSIHINCSSDAVPIGKAAAIHIEQLYYHIRYHNSRCFSTALANTCSFEICQCSTNGLWFSHKFNATQHDGFINIVCSMLFGQREVYSNRIQVRIVEFSTPKIYPDVEFPLQSGSIVRFSCKVEKTKHHVIFKWDCLKNESTDTTNGDSTKYSSIITRTLHLNHDNRTCICSANIDGYVATASIQVYISKKPNLHVDQSILCNTSFPINISCKISSETSVYGFNMWEHSLKGKSIRSLEGRIYGRESVLTITSCSFQDIGEYRCTAWNTFGEQTFYASKTVRIHVNSPPMIVSANQFHEKNVTLSVLFCSLSNATQIWSIRDTPINKSIEMTESLRRKLVSINVYNVTIDCDGYIANLTISSNSDAHIIVRLQNDFGETRHTFRLDLVKVKDFTLSFDLRSIFIGVTAIGMFILTATITAILMKGKRRSYAVHVVGPHELSTIPIYHAAPSSAPVIHLYDTANSGYLEIIDNDHHESNSSESDNKDSGEDSQNTTNNVHVYEDID